MQKAKLLTVADRVSIARAILAPVFAVACLLNVFLGWFGAVFLAWRWLGWAILGASDKLDGTLARKFGSSQYGETLDEMSDKVCMLSAFAACIILGIAPWYLLAIMIARDVLIIGIRGRMRKSGDRSINGARWMGKVKTVLQFVLITVAMLPSDMFRLIFQHENQAMSVEVLALVATVLSLASGWQYFRVAAAKLWNKN